ncbi:MAG: hypothetical protein SVM80_09065 [Halobacteriota archaeon]|nr:hypothetical protein [Halobacteriota archaeon]
MAGILTEDDLNRVEAIKKLKAEQLAEIEDKWIAERDNLERRVKECTEELSFDDGTTITIRTRLSELESNRIDAIMKMQKSLGEDDKEKKAQLTYELLSIVTANPLFTIQYFSDNQDKYASLDLSDVITAFYEELGNRKDRVKKVQSFRNK